MIALLMNCSFVIFQPVLTLNHRDVPQTLMDEYGAWESRRIIKDFDDYCITLYKRFGDR